MHLGQREEFMPAAYAELPVHSPDPDRVRANTWPDVTARLDREARTRLRTDAAALSASHVSDRIEALEREWDFDRLLEAESASMGLIGLMLFVGVDRRFLVLPGFVSAMVLLHSLHGWYPLLPLFRRIGVRTRDEIDRERYALKVMRGDFDQVPPVGSAAAERAAAAWKAVCE